MMVWLIFWLLADLYLVGVVRSDILKTSCVV